MMSKKKKKKVKAFRGENVDSSVLEKLEVIQSLCDKMDENITTAEESIAALKEKRVRLMLDLEFVKKEYMKAVETRAKEISSRVN